MSIAETSSAVAAFFSAIATAFAAWATWRSAQAASNSAEAARQAVKATIFKERMDVLSAFLDFHRYWIGKGHPPLGGALSHPEATEIWRNFLWAQLKAKLLFDSDVQDIFDEYRKMAARYVSLVEHNKDGRDEEVWTAKAGISSKVTNADEFDRIVDTFRKAMSIDL